MPLPMQNAAEGTDHEWKVARERKERVLGLPAASFF